ncbi:MAG: DUF7504 family protein [Halobacteriota archaeon]
MRGEDAVSFAHALDILKEQGSSLLVVGSVPTEMYTRASKQMLGAPDASPPRRRLLVMPEGERHRAPERLERTGPNAPNFARVITHEASARSAAASQTASVSSQLQITSVDGTLSQLGIAISDAISEFDTLAGGLEPAELRFAFDCLPTLLAEYNEEAVFRFLHIITTQVRLVRGMGHFWLPQELNGEMTRSLRPLFDAVIELRIDDGVLKQRWHFRDTDLVSDWLACDP